MKYYAFEFKGGLHTTTGEPNQKTGHLSIAGILAIFSKKEDRDEWVYNGKTTMDMQGNCRACCNAYQARSLCLGMSVDAYREYVEMMLDCEVVS